MSCKYPIYNVVFMKCLHILSRFLDIGNGKEKIRKQNSKSLHFTKIKTLSFWNFRSWAKTKNFRNKKEIELINVGVLIRAEGSDIFSKKIKWDRGVYWGPKSKVGMVLPLLSHSLSLSLSLKFVRIMLKSLKKWKDISLLKSKQISATFALPAILLAETMNFWGSILKWTA